jgi:hypothetical protein
MPFEKNGPKDCVDENEKGEEALRTAINERTLFALIC